MLGSSKEFEEGFKEEEVMKVLFGEQFGCLAEDGFDGSKAEHQIFKEVFCGTGTDHARNARGVLGISNSEIHQGTNGKSLVSPNHGGLVVTSCSSVKDSSGKASEHAKIKEMSALECFQESSSSWAGPSAHNLHVIQAKLSSTKQLDIEKKEPQHGSADVPDDLVRMLPSEDVSNVPVKDSVHEPVPCHVVESFGQGILSSHFLVNSEGEVVGVSSVHDTVVLDSKSRVQGGGDGKIALEGKPVTVTSPVSQESVACGLLAASVPLASAEMPEAGTCVKQSAEESMNLDKDVAPSKRPLNRALPIHLESLAHRLLIDAGWIIEPRVRNDRKRPAYFFINTSEGLVLKALSAAWKSCGEILSAAALDSERDENGREWSDVNRFWSDLTDTLAYLEKEAHYQESSVSFLRRWQLLDPFMAVIWIHKRVGALRAGKKLKAVKSETYILNESKKIILADRDVDGAGCNVTEHSSAGNLNQGILPAHRKFEEIEGLCNQQALDKQDHHDLQSRHRCAQADQTCCSEEWCNRSLNSLTRSAQEIQCSCDMGSEDLASQHKRSKRSRKLKAMQKDSHFGRFDPEGKLLVGNEPCEETVDAQKIPVSYHEGKTCCEERDDLREGEGLVDENAPDDSVRVVSQINRKDTSLPQGGRSKNAMLLCNYNKAEGSSDCSIIQHGEDPHVLEEIRSFSVDDDHSCGDLLATEKMVGYEASKSRLKRTSESKTTSGSTKKARKKSKKISEIGATQASSKGMITKLSDDKCREVVSLSSNVRTDDHHDLPTHLEETKSLRLEPNSECLKKQMGDVHHSSRIEEVHASAAVEIHKNSLKSKAKAPRLCDEKDDAAMPLEDEAGGTLSMEDIGHCKSADNDFNAKRLFFDKSNSASSKKQKVISKTKKARLQLIDPEASVIPSEYGNIALESHSENTRSEVLDSNSGLSSNSRCNKKFLKAKKSGINKEIGGKRSHGCHINDDDLLIAAIIKKKDLGPRGKLSALKGGPSQLKVLRKLKSRKGSCKLLPRSFGKGGKHSMDGKRVILGARTTLCWLIEMGALSHRDIIQYRNPKNNEVVKDGWVTREGILCTCCSQILSVSEFKAHARFKQQRPSLNLFLQSGKPYTLCQLQAWSTEYRARKNHVQVIEAEEVDQNDDTCGLCGDGGELICCDNCPSTYHQACLSAKELPEGSWYCPNCICDTCGLLVNGKESLNSLDVLECSQCEHKYHEACIKGEVTCDGEARPGTWFCGESCQKVYLGLRSRVGVVNCLDDGFSWTILRCNHDDQKVCSAQKIALMAECNTKLAIALTLMEECFLPMVDPRTGIDMIPHVLYNWGSNFVRLNYQGFYAVILEEGDKLISVASIRVHGVTVAEVPLIATCSEHRRQGMCRRLLNAIEKMLISFKVKMLVLTAIPSLVETWTSGFGFRLIEDEEKKHLANINLMLFPGTTLLKKDLHEASAEESGGNVDSYSRDILSQICEDGERANSESGQQSAENPRSGLDAESFLPSNTDSAEEKVGNLQRDLLNSSCENSVLTVRPREHCNVSNAEPLSVRIGTSNTCEMPQFFSSEQAISIQMPVSQVSTAGHTCSGTSTSTETNEELSIVPSSDRTDVVVKDVEENNTSQNVIILDKDNVIDAMKNMKRISFEGDEVEQRNMIDASVGKEGVCLSEGRAEEGPHLPARNELSSDPSSNEASDVTVKDLEEKNVQIVNMLSEDSAANEMGQGKGAFGGDEIEQKCCSDASERQDGVCLSDRQAEAGSCLAAPNLNHASLGGVNSSEVNTDEPSRNSKDEICGFVERHPVSKGYTTGSVEA